MQLAQVQYRHGWLGVKNQLSVYLSMTLVLKRRCAWELQVRYWTQTRFFSPLPQFTQLYRSRHSPSDGGFNM